MSFNSIKYLTKYKINRNKFISSHFSSIFQNDVLKFRILFPNIYCNFSTTTRFCKNEFNAFKSRNRFQRKRAELKEYKDLDALIQYEDKEQHHRFLTFDPVISVPRNKFTHKSQYQEFQIMAYATADEYKLGQLADAFQKQGVYKEIQLVRDESQVSVELTSVSKTRTEFLILSACYQVTDEPRTMFVFRDGVIIFWNIPLLERKKILTFIQPYESRKYSPELIADEAESLMYTHTEQSTKLKSSQNTIYLREDGDSNFEKFAFSHALALSVKLGIWEASLEKYIENIEYVTEELGKSGGVVLSQHEVLERMGQLLGLRHLINLSSDLLDTPDIYWEQDSLEQLFNRMSNHLSIQKRTSVINVKLNHCLELMELLKTHLHDRHSSRLEWIIIILIMFEVFFEILHFVR